MSPSPATLDRAAISVLAHAHHPICGPLDDASVDALLSRVALPPKARVLDVGCGPGEWLIRALERNSGATGEGVDPSPGAVGRARRAGKERLGPARVTWWECGIEEIGLAAGSYDLVLCVGATHAFGGLAPTLAGVARRLRPGGRALVGAGFWERTPGEPALAALDARRDEFPDLAGLVEAARVAGFLPLAAHVSSQAEWDRYEFSWAGALVERAVAEPVREQGEELRRVAQEHLAAYLGGYRGVLGFATLLLTRPSALPA